MKQTAPAALRNRGPIAGILRDILPQNGRVLMIAEGSGVHAAYFAARFPALDWLPTDPDPAARASIDAWQRESGLANLQPARALDVTGNWPVDAADAITCINMVHISPWRASAALFAGAARILPPRGPLYLYGPFRREGVATAASNLAFDASLKARNPAWGLRQLSDVIAIADRNGLCHVATRDMPANNLSVIFRRAG